MLSSSPPGSGPASDDRDGPRHQTKASLSRSSSFSSAGSARSEDTTDACGMSLNELVSRGSSVFFEADREVAVVGSTALRRRGGRRSCGSISSQGSFGSEGFSDVDVLDAWKGACSGEVGGRHEDDEDDDDDFSYAGVYAMGDYRVELGRYSSCGGGGGDSAALQLPSDVADGGTRDERCDKGKRVPGRAMIRNLRRPKGAGRREKDDGGSSGQRDEPIAESASFYFDC